MMQFLHIPQKQLLPPCVHFSRIFISFERSALEVRKTLSLSHTHCACCFSFASTEVVWMKLREKKKTEREKMM